MTLYSRNVFRAPAPFDAGRVQSGSQLDYLWAGETLRARQVGHKVKVIDASGNERILGPRLGQKAAVTRIKNRVAKEKKLAGPICPSCFIPMRACFCVDLHSTGMTAASNRVPLTGEVG